MNAQKDGSSLKRLLMELDEKDWQALKSKNLSDPAKLEKAQGELSVMKFLAEKEQKSKFQNKRYQELDRLVHSAHHTRGNIRIKFPDGYLLQGTFGAKETVEAVYKFVAEALFYKPD